MIDYDPKSIAFICGIRGSVFPKGLMWAIPSALLAVLLRLVWPDRANQLLDLDGVDTIWSGYTFVLGFLVVFRNSQAYSRFWEGATLIQQTRGEWFNAVSSLFAFSTQKPEKAQEVERFQKLIVHLMSVLFCQALQQICDLEDDALEIISLRCLEEEQMKFLAGTSDRCEVILQWIQRAIVDATDAGVVTVAPPILSRAYQELSRGMVNLSNVRKIKDVPFPFPYAQMIAVMLLIHFVMTPVIAAQYIPSPIWAGVMSFLVTGAFWSLVYIAQEIDHPFGEDPNDFNIAELMQNMNTSLLTLLQPPAQRVPLVDVKSLTLVRSDKIVLGTAEVEKRKLFFSRRSMSNMPPSERDERVRRLSEVQSSLAVPEAPEGEEMNAFGLASLTLNHVGANLRSRFSSLSTLNGSMNAGSQSLEKGVAAIQEVDMEVHSDPGTVASRTPPRKSVRSEWTVQAATEAIVNGTPRSEKPPSLWSGLSSDLVQLTPSDPSPGLGQDIDWQVTNLQRLAVDGPSKRRALSDDDLVARGRRRNNLDDHLAMLRIGGLAPRPRASERLRSRPVEHYVCPL